MASNYEESTGIAVDAANSATIVGWTESPTSPARPAPSIQATTMAPRMATPLRSSSTRPAAAWPMPPSWAATGPTRPMRSRSTGRAARYVTGFVYSVNFPTTFGAFDTSYNYSGDSFVLKLNPAGSALDYGTFLGWW